MVNIIKQILSQNIINGPIEITPSNFIVSRLLLDGILYELHLTNNIDIEKAILIDDIWYENKLKDPVLSKCKHDIYICTTQINITNKTISLDEAYLTFVPFNKIKKTFITINKEIKLLLIKAGITIFNDNELYHLPLKRSSKNYKLTTITTVYNNALLLEQTIQSIINQNVDRGIYQYIIKDACSQDGFQQLIKKYEQYINIVIITKDKGLYYGMNEAIDYAEGEYINFLNSDDCYASIDSVKDIIEKLRDNNTAYYGQLKLFNNNKHSIYSNYNIKDLYKYCAVGHPALFTPKKALIKAGKFNTNLKISADVWMTIKLKKDGCNFNRIQTTYVLFRATGISSKYKYQRLKEDIRCRLYFHPLNIIGILLTIYHFIKND